MKAHELRFGNYVINSFGEISEIFEMHNEGVWTMEHNGKTWWDNYDEIQPIELTEEVLLRIGFKKFERMFRMELSEFHLDYFIVVGVLRIYKKLTDCYFDKNLEIKCEYLHQLQNAYHLLTGQELEVEL